MRYAIINPQGQVVRVIDRGEKAVWKAPIGHSVVPCSEAVDIGYSYDGNVFYATQSRPDFYQALYPLLMGLFAVSYVTLMVGLGMWLFQLTTDNPTPWLQVCLAGFTGTWVFPALVLLLGLKAAKPKLDMNFWLRD